ncbi:MAG: flagellar basal-body MS-ring/collar protein FliF [Kofleriaceae bacterium]
MADTRPNPALQVLSQLKDLWGKQPKGRKTLAVVVVVGIAGVIAFTQLSTKTERWGEIATSPDDAQTIHTLLSQRGIPVRFKDNKIEVEIDKLDQARAIIAATGNTSGGGYADLDKQSPLVSGPREALSFRRALEGELSRNIASLGQVESARVLIAYGKQSVFREQEQPASASVTMHLHPGQTLSAEQVRGVRQMVAAAVSGMKPEAVVILDGHGNPLDGAAPGTLDRKADIEHSLTMRVRTMLERVVGAGKVSVVATAVVDDRKVSETQELYDQTNPALRSESRVLEGDAATTAGMNSGVAGTRGNLPGATPPTTTGANPTANNRFQETKNYEVNKTVRQTVKPDVVLTKLSVAVVVDQKTGPDGKSMARTPEELGELTAIARQAAGIDDARGDKIEVHSIAFAPEVEAAPVAAPVAEGLPLIPLAIGGGALVVLIAIVMFMKARSKRNKLVAQRPLTFALPAPIADLERVLEARPHLDASAALEAAAEARALPPGKAVRERVIEVVRADAERAAEVLTAWLSERPAATPRGAKS